MAVREQLYDLVQPFDTGFLNVSDIHTLHYEQAGNPVSRILQFGSSPLPTKQTLTTLERKSRGLCSWWSWRWHWSY
jgi:hypothetical protein